MPERILKVRTGFTYFKAPQFALLLKSMIAPLDPRTKKFYLEMGYSEKQIQQAFECSRSTGVDMLDALAMTQDSPPLPKVQPQKPSAV